MNHFSSQPAPRHSRHSSAICHAIHHAIHAIQSRFKRDSNAIHVIQTIRTPFTPGCPKGRSGLPYGFVRVPQPLPTQPPTLFTLLTLPVSRSHQNQNGRINIGFERVSQSSKVGEVSKVMGRWGLGPKKFDFSDTLRPKRLDLHPNPPHFHPETFDLRHPSPRRSRSASNFRFFPTKVFDFHPPFAHPISVFVRFPGRKGEIGWCQQLQQKVYKGSSQTSLEMVIISY